MIVRKLSSHSKAMGAHQRNRSCTGVFSLVRFGYLGSTADYQTSTVLIETLCRRQNLRHTVRNGSSNECHEYFCYICRLQTQHLYHKYCTSWLFLSHLQTQRPSWRLLQQIKAPLPICLVCRLPVPWIWQINHVQTYWTQEVCSRLETKNETPKNSVRTRQPESPRN